MAEFNIIAIIPVRGGSKGIPRKNARLLHGKPLMSYVLRAAFESHSFSDVVVSTDNEELAYIGKEYGALIIRRSAHLASDEVGLDEVIVDAVEEYEKQTKRIVDIVVTLQATSPLLRPETIQKAVKKCIDEKKDTVVSVTEDVHLRWKLNENGDPIPDYSKRLNRQYLPKHYRETGGIVVCTRDQLRHGTRFGGNVGIVECDKIESVDIDDRFDWWLVEKQMARLRILYRVEGYNEIGLGHIYRCLMLADSRIDHEHLFVISNKSRPGIKKIRSRFYPIIEFDPSSENEVSLIKRCNPDIVINDILDTNLDYVTALKQSGFRVINFEDLGQGQTVADAVINAMYGSEVSRKSDHIFSGPDYVCLRDEFYNAKTINIKEKVKNILLLFGGTDPSNLTEKIIKWVLKIKKDLELTVIVGPGYKHLSQLEKNIDKLNGKIQIITDTNIISKYMAEADIAITSGGRTVFELAAMGIPMIVINQNEREVRHVFANQELGIINLGLSNLLTFGVFEQAFKEIIGSQILRKKMHQSLTSFDFKSGIDRVWDIILGKSVK